VLIAGNHDLVLQGLGPARVQTILNEEAAGGTAPPVYLEHGAVELRLGRGKVRHHVTTA
jgi:hypothetical protein